VKPIRIDFTPLLVPKSNRTVWFAVVSTASVVFCFTPTTTPNGAPSGDYRVNWHESGSEQIVIAKN
jgi:hypothetical protein